MVGRKQSGLMANPQPDKFTRVSNEIMDALVKTRIPGQVRQVFDLALRETYGFKRKVCEWDPGYVSKKTGLNRISVYRAILTLERHKLLSVYKKEYRYRISIQKDYEKWPSVVKYVYTKAYTKKKHGVYKKETTPIKEKTKKLERAKKLPADFKITPSMHSWFTNQNFKYIPNLKTETDKFIDYWTAKGGKYVDWVAAWRNWMRKAEEFRQDKDPTTTNPNKNLDDLAKEQYAEIHRLRRKYGNNS
jgi:phage replication O-like protein O